MLGVVDGEARGPKMRVFKKKRRKGFRKQAGHRAFYHAGAHHRHHRLQLSLLDQLSLEYTHGS